MKLTVKSVPIESLQQELKRFLAEDETHRVGHLTSIDGSQVVLMVLKPSQGAAEVWQSEIEGNHYTSLTTQCANLHWMERVMCDMFGIVPEHHPRLKPVLMQHWYPVGFYPLRTAPLDANDLQMDDREFHFLDVRGDGVWQLPVGPIHAGVIEPGHFRFSCMGEYIQNLELKLGYVHRGLEKRMTEVPWQKLNFVAELIAGDTTVGNSLASAIALESLVGVEVPPLAQALRTVALEVERAAMHIIDVGGVANDLGMTGIYQNFSKFRGMALAIGDAIAGSRFVRAYVVCGGVRREPRAPIDKILANLRALRQNLKQLCPLLMENQSAIDRMEGIGRLKPALASEFGMLGVTGRAANVNYDTRRHFKHGLYPDLEVPVAVEPAGDIFARTKVRVREIFASLDVIEQVLSNLPTGPITVALPEKLPANEVSVGIVEGFRGELMHWIFTDDKGNIKRYSIKDPSWNNWTAISIAIRNGLIADFPLCNKSLALSYSGNDL
jgi:Ni,Fe-hydrogenase III large subunit/Ni,Fe-hydrogenase III component G